MKPLNYTYDSLKWTERIKNKDDILIIENDQILFYMLFDGVSSSNNAKRWINIIKKFIWKNIISYIIDGQLMLKSLVLDSNNFLLTQSIENAFSTCSIFSYSKSKDKYSIINIGDSRIYGIHTNFIKKLTIDDNEDYNKNILTKSLWMYLDDNSINEILISKEDIYESNILICSDGFYNIFEINKLLFHKILHFKRLWNIQKRLKKEINRKNIDDSSYIYILT